MAAVLPPCGMGAQRQAFISALLSEGVSVAECSEGLELVASKCYEPGDVIMASDAEFVCRLDGMYEEVETVLHSMPFCSFLAASFYFAALRSLTIGQAGEEFVDRVGSDISQMDQDTMLALHAPKALSWRAAGMQVQYALSPEDYEALGGSGSPPAGYADLAILAMVEHFHLSPMLAPLLQTLALVWKYNSFDLGDSRIGVFVVPSMCNHSCLPSADFSIACRADGSAELVLTALRRLEPGDEVTISYIAGGAAGSSCATARRKQIASGWLFYCQCEACSPPGHQDVTCQKCQGPTQIWISDRDSGPYGPKEGPTCDVCGEEDLVVLAPYFFHCKSCEMDLCPECAAGLPKERPKVEPEVSEDTAEPPSECKEVLKDKDREKSELPVAGDAAGALVSAVSS